MREELEAILEAKSPVSGPFKYNSGKIVCLGPEHIQSLRMWPMHDGLLDQLNRAFAIGYWLGQAESEPPLAQEDTCYRPICKFCDTMADEMVTVHMREGDYKMCMKCFMWPAHRKDYVGPNLQRVKAKQEGSCGKVLPGIRQSDGVWYCTLPSGHVGPCQGYVPPWHTSMFRHKYVPPPETWKTTSCQYFDAESQSQCCQNPDHPIHK